MHDIAAAADLLRPVWENTQSHDGYVSIEVRPTLAHDTAGTVAEARRLFGPLSWPNIMIKVPGTPEGIPAVETLIGEGINVNVTLLFAIQAYEAAAQAYIAGLQRRAAAGGDISRVASVASFFVSRVDTSVDRQLEALIAGGRSDLKPLLGKAAIANAKLAYARFKEVLRRPSLQRAQGQRGAGAAAAVGQHRHQKPAVQRCALRRRADRARHSQHRAAGDACRFHRSRPHAANMEAGVDEARRAMEQLAASGVNMEAVTDELLVDGVKALSDSFAKLLANLEDNAPG